MAPQRRWTWPAVLIGVAIAGSLGWIAVSSRSTRPPGAADPARADADRAGVVAQLLPSSAAPVESAGAAVQSRDHGRAPDPQGAVSRSAAVDGQPVEASEQERREAERLLADMGKIVRDLEFTPGLPEPVQQVVARQPEPWRRDPEREGPPPVIDSVAPLRGTSAGGERVVIRGRNLRASQVMFGSSPARLLDASGTALTVEAPPGKGGPVSIAITNEDGTWAVSGTAYVYAE